MLEGEIWARLIDRLFGRAYKKIIKITKVSRMLVSLIVYVWILGLLSIDIRMYAYVSKYTLKYSGKISGKYI